MRPLAVACFADETAPAQRLAAQLGAALQPVTVHHFPDGEIMPVVPAPAGDVTVVYRSLDRPNLKLIELLLATDAWRRAGAGRLILVAPYFCYLRQDAVFAPGEPLSRDVVGPLIGARFDGVVTVQAHLHRTRDLTTVLGVPTLDLWPIDALAAALPKYHSPPLIIGPDAESAPWSAAWAERLGGEAISLTKVRSGDRSVEVRASTLPAGGRAVVLVDDIAASGQTLCQAARLAQRAGASTIDVAVAHVLMPPTAVRRLREAGVRRIVSTDSVHHATNAIELAPMLANAVRDLIEAS